jgi:DNA-binding NtrC family response regulator
VHFLEQASQRLRLPMPRFTEAHARLLQSYDWPGNVRELQNVTERALILAQRGPLQFDLPLPELSARSSQPAPAPNGNGAGPAILTERELRQREQQNLLAALAKSNWKIHGENGAAELLGVKPTTLISRIKKLGLKKPG